MRAIGSATARARKSGDGSIRIVGIEHANDYSNGRAISAIWGMYVKSVLELRHLRHSSASTDTPGIRVSIYPVDTMIRVHIYPGSIFAGLHLLKP